MSTIINRVFFVILVYSLISCNTNKQYKKADIQQKIDSIVRIAEDSITCNITFVHSQVDSVMHLAQDSVQRNEANLLDALSYLAADSYDTAFNYIKHILVFCEGKRLNPKINNLNAKANNALGIYFQRIGNADSAISPLQKSLSAAAFRPKRSAAQYSDKSSRCISNERRCGKHWTIL